MELFDYMETPKYKNYTRNRQIFEEKSSGIFRQEVNSRVKLELMGSGAIVNNDTVFSGFNGNQSQYSNISDLIVPCNLLSSITSAYIGFATNGRVMFKINDNDTTESDYMLQKVKTAIIEQSVGGSCLMKLVTDEIGGVYINIFNVISYYAVPDDSIQDKNKAYVIFNLESDVNGKETYLLERHEGTLVTYRKITREKKTTNGKQKAEAQYIDTQLPGLQTKEDENGIIYSYETLKKPAVAEVTNTVFSGESDYTDDNVALLREIVVLNTINSQTFDKIANPLLTIPEDALEYDDAGNARVNLQDRTVIIRGESSQRPEQISLESKIEQTDKHRENLEGQIFSSLAVNTIALGIGGGNLSGIALERMLTNVSSRVIDKRNNIAKAFKEVSGIEIEFDDPIGEKYDEQVSTIKKAVEAGIMSVKEGCKRIGNEDDYKQIMEERKADLGGYIGFDTADNGTGNLDDATSAGEAAVTE